MHTYVRKNLGRSHLLVRLRFPCSENIYSKVKPSESIYFSAILRHVLNVVSVPTDSEALLWQEEEPALASTTQLQARDTAVELLGSQGECVLG